MTHTSARMAAAATPGEFEGSVRITDPRHEPVEKPNFFERVALGMILDKRDLPFMKLMATYTVVMLPLAIAMYVPGVYRWWIGVAYTALNFGVFVDRLILMLHCTSHRPLFKPKYKLLNTYFVWVLGPLFGEAPEGYFSHHMGMHHPENNLKEDLSTTMPYQRDSFLCFLHYWGTFMLTTLFALTRYLWRKGRKKLAIKAFLGDSIWYLGAGVGLYFAFWPTFWVFVLPFVVVRFLMMWGNWGQHAFIDPERPENCYVNSITCINSRYNRRCFNDGYHISHHWKANRHWTDHPKELEDNLAAYAREGAIVFEGIDFFMVSLWLFLGRYDWLAEKYVHLGGPEKSKDEIIALMKSRLKPIPFERAPEQSA
jgi:fatty acid desaturase